VKKDNNIYSEFDFLELFRFLRGKTKKIIFVFSISLIVGLFIAFSLPVEYRSSCTLYPDSSSGKSVGGLSGLGSIAGLAGLNLDLSSSSTLSPQLYPRLLYSVPFQEKLLARKIQFQSPDTTITSYTYFNKIYQKPRLSKTIDFLSKLPWKLKNRILGEKMSPVFHQTDSVLIFDKDTWELMQEFKSRSTIAYDQETGLIEVSAIMPDAFASANLTLKIIELLTEDLIQYKTEKSMIKYEFIRSRFGEAEKDYQVKQEDLANFQDSNQNISSSSYSLSLQARRNEVDLAFEVYKSLASQLEQAKIEIKEKTPVFSIIEPVRVPLEKDSPNRLMVLLTSIIVITSFYVLYLSVNFIINKLKTEE